MGIAPTSRSALRGKLEHVLETKRTSEYSLSGLRALPYPTSAIVLPARVAHHDARPVLDLRQAASWAAGSSSRVTKGYGGK